VGGVLVTPALWERFEGGDLPDHTTSAAPSIRPDILNNGRYPVGLWVAPPPHETTNARYAEIAEAGFTFVIGIDGCGGFCQPGETTTPDNAPLLNAAAANGLQALVFDKRVGHIQNYPQDQWRDIIATTLREYQKFPAFAGFDIRDEPHASAFEQIGVVNRVLRDLDPRVLGYVNLFPTYASADQLGTPTYEEHLDRYVTEAVPDVISFDHYALLGPSPAVRADYFHNWVLVRRQALRSGLPSWVFILACSHYGYRLPTQAELLWQINVSLAYGCKGIQYFTYWTPPLDGFYEALVSVDGQLTPLYYAAEQINNGHLQPVGRQLLPLISESVAHFGEAEPPMSVDVFEGDYWVSSASGSAAILSRFADRQDPDRRWLLVVNRAFDAAASTSLTLDRRVDAVFEYQPAHDRFTAVRPDSHGRPRTLSVETEPGASRLYRLHRDRRP
jgi:hypothetical protein